jgi:hypothetical protein
LKALKEEFQKGPCCPYCTAAITGTRRYGRVVKKAQADLTDKKFTLKMWQDLRQAANQLIALEKRAAESLLMEELSTVYSNFQTLYTESLKSPSRKVEPRSSGWQPFSSQALGESARVFDHPATIWIPLQNNTCYNGHLSASRSGMKQKALHRSCAGNLSK